MTTRKVVLIEDEAGIGMRTVPMSVAEVLHHWWMWAYHKGAASYFRAMTFDA